MLHECDTASGKQAAASEQQDVAIWSEELLSIIHEEMETVQSVIQLRLADSRMGFESSNHYFYTPQDLREKMINLAFCEEKIEER